MINIFKDIYRFIGYLSFVDIVFFASIIALLILLVVLFYFIKINKEVINEDDLFNIVDKEVKNKKKADNTVEIQEEKSDEDAFSDENGNLLNLETLTKKLKTEENMDIINCNDYEKDQEEKAIISYDELLEKSNKYAINYEKEEVIDDLIVKKIDMNNFNNIDGKIAEKEEVRVISYDHEEAFLRALKELNSLLN